MLFKQFNALLKAQFALMFNMGTLYSVDTNEEQLTEVYLGAFKNDPVFRCDEASQHECRNCFKFLRDMGHAIVLDENNNIVTLFDFDIEDEVYAPVAKAMSEFIKSKPIANIFLLEFNELFKAPYESGVKKDNADFAVGMPVNYKRYTAEEAAVYPGTVEVDKQYEFNHLHARVPAQYVNTTSVSIASIMAEKRDIVSVFARGMREVSIDTLEMVKDLATRGSLRDGGTYLPGIEAYINIKKEYLASEESTRPNWCWVKGLSIGVGLAKLMGSVIGTLCYDIEKDISLEEACLKFNKKVDPANYKQVTAPRTRAQEEAAEAFIIENGYEASFDREPATINDVRAVDIKYVDRTGKIAVRGGLFGGLKATTPTKNSGFVKGQFDNIPEISIEKFMEEVLPTASSVEAFVENKHSENLVAMMKATDPNSPLIFPWNNNLSWTYSNNLTGVSSIIKTAVASKGGKVDGELRFSIMWAEKDGDNSDLDAHAKETIKNRQAHIYFGDRVSKLTGGELDVDITNPRSQMPEGAVENITYQSLANLEGAVIDFSVHQFSGSNSKGFKAEVEWNGELYSYEYKKPLSSKQTVRVVTARIINGKVEFQHHLEETGNFTSKEVWGINTNGWVPVNLMSLLPNHWGEIPVGNKHYFFGLKDCAPTTQLKSFHLEFLKSEFTPHRKVMAPLSDLRMVDPSPNQLAGLGFNATLRDSIVVKCVGEKNKLYRITF